MTGSMMLFGALTLIGSLAVGGCADGGPTDPATPDGTIALASARKPERLAINETYSIELDCGTFTGLAQGRFSGTETAFFDRQGNLSRLQGHLRYRATITNTATGKTLKDDSAYNYKVDLVSGVVEANGRIYNVKDRETGFRIKDIGRIVFDAAGNVSFKAGRHDVNAFDDSTPLYCRALA